MDVKALARRFEPLVTDRTTAQEEWDLIRRFIYPIGGGKFWDEQSSEHQMTWRAREVFDDTAMVGVDTLASAIHSAMTPSGSKWFEARFRNPEFANDQDAAAWLAEATELVWQEIQASNFDLEIAESYLDLTAFGNAVLTHEAVSELDWQGFHFKSVPLKEWYFETDHRGELTHAYRLLRWTPEQVISKFGVGTGDDTTLGKIAEAAERGETTRIEIVFAVTPNPNASPSEEHPTVASKRPYQGVYWLRESREQLGKQLGYYEMPVYFFKWRHATGSSWGYGPSHLALPSVLTINQLKKLILTNAEKVVDPPILATQRGVIGDVDLAAGGVTIVRSLDGSMQPFETGARFDVSQLEVEKLREQIRNHYRMSQLELADGPQMTATEVEVRYELMHRLLGPTHGRIRVVLDKVIARSFAMLSRAGRLPDMPESLVQAQVSGQDSGVDLHYLGPLARAQSMDKVLNAQRWGMMVGEMVQLGFEDARMSVDGVELSRYMAREMNVPLQVVRSDEDLGYIQQLEQQIQQMAGNIEMLSQMVGDGEDGQEQPNGGANPPSV